MMIRTRLLILFIVVTLIPAVVISAIAWLGGVQASGAQIIRQLESVVTLKSAFIRELVANEQTELESIQQIALFRPRATKFIQGAQDPITHEAFRASLQNVVDTHQVFQEIALMTAEGRITISTDSAKNGSQVAAVWLPFLAKAIQATQSRIIQTDAGSIFVSGQPVLDVAGQPVGVLVGQTDLTVLNQMMNERTGLGESGITYLVSAEKRLLNQNAMLPTEALNTEGVETALATRSRLSGEFTNPLADEVLGVYQWLPELEAILVAEQNKDEAYAPTYSILQTSLGVALVSIVIALGMGVRMTRRISQPLQNLVEVASNIAKGNLTLRADVSRPDEFGQLATSFNEMTEQLRHLIDNLEEQNEELKRLDRLKDDFLANTSHELRTPLTGIIGIAESMVEGATGDMTSLQQDNLQLIISSGERLANLVNDILDFAKLHRQRLNLKIQPTQLYPLVDMILRILAPLRNNKPIELVNLIPPDGPLVQADKDRLEQILHNLVGNAIKFTEAGSITLSTRVDGPMVTIIVTDTGIGIAEDRLDRIFTAFEQADGSVSRKYGGTGLGLAVTQQLVELHGSTLQVTSTEGQGTEFSFELHLADEKELEDTKEFIISEIPELPQTVIPKESDLSVEAADSLSSIEGEFSILVVDDEPINRQVLFNQLSLHDYRIVTVPDGTVALETLQEKEEQFDLIILDVMMPYMSGYEVCREIRQRFSLNELPVIMLTAKDQADDLLDGFTAGANDYLTKPFSKVELLARIRVHLQVTDLRQLNASKDKFFSIVAHDLKGPFGPLLGLTELLAESYPELSTDEIGQMAGSVYRSAKTVYNLLENLLEWSRLQMGRMPFDPQMVHVVDLVEDTAALFIQNAHQKDITLQTDVTPDIYTKADNAMLKTVLRNLTSNALKFTPSGGTVTIAADVRNGRTPKRIEISVADTGLGMSEVDLQKLFRVDVHHTTKGTANESGTGLGLIMCQEMVEQHGGQIWVESEIGHGTTFTFTLPWVDKSLSTSALPPLSVN